MYAEVSSVNRINPGLIRIVFCGGELEQFESTNYTDEYINGYFVPAEASYTVPFDLDAVRELGNEFRPRPRRVTVRKWDDTKKEMTVDFVVHGQRGYAGPWAQQAQPGDRLQFKGPSGSYSPDPNVDWHLFAGDESAIPAISSALESLKTESCCVVFLVVDSEAFQIPVTTQAQTEISWLYRENSGNPSTLLLNAIQEHKFKEGTFDVFVHGEAAEVRGVRKYLIGECKVDPKSSISPYWRRHHTDEDWRAIKKEWLAEQENDI